MDNRKIFIVSYCFPSEEGGVGIAAAEMASSFHQKGWEIQVLTKTQGVIETPFPVHILPENLSSSSDELINYLRRLIDHFRPNFIIYHSWSTWCRRELLSCSKEYDIPFILRSHGVSTNFLSHFRLNCPPFFGFKKWLTSWSRVKRDIRQVLQQSGKNRLALLDSYGTFFKSYDCYYAYKHCQEQLNYIPNTFQQLKKNGISFMEKYGMSGKNVFTYAASASDLKQQRTFINHLKNIHIDNLIFLFLVPTKNEYSAKMEQDINGDERFRILYELPREEIIAAITESYAVCLYSYQEQQPLCLLEAMSCGVPWISSNVGAVSTFKGGIVLNKRTPKLLKQAVLELLDAHTHSVLGTEGKKYWEDSYSPEIVYQQWENLLNSI